jgi:TonB-linked SusC/RagA family outer membrane protein
MKLFTIERINKEYNCKRKAIMIMSLLLMMIFCIPINSFANSNNSIENLVSGVEGTVRDKNGPLPGVNVVVKGTTISTSTDFDGKYILKNIPDNARLVFSFVGYIDYEIDVNALSKIDVVLQEENQNLKEVVVIGYGTAKKKDLTGAVSTVSRGKFAEQNVTRIDQILQGRAAGVQVSNTVGAPGADVKIRVRGSNSILGSNDPLYVIDGYVGADYNSINPNDIETLQVLKDASSTAIYGSRGANGVIIIKTKSGKKGQMNISFQSEVSISNVLKQLDVLSAADYATTVNQRRFEINGASPLYTQAQIDEWKVNGGTKWQDEIFRTALATNNQLTVSGGSDKTDYLISLNYLDQEGTVENSNFKRYNLRSNLNSKITDKLSVRLNISGSNMTNFNTPIRIGSSGNPVVQALSWAPITPIYDASGNYTLADPSSSVKSNPLALVYDQEDKNERTILNVIGAFNYEFVDGLSWDSQYAINYVDRIQSNYSGIYMNSGVANASIADSQEKLWQTTNSLTYKATFNKIHNINAVAVFESQKFEGFYNGATATGLRYPALKYNNLGQANANTASSSYSGTSLLSYLARVNYSLMDKYLFSVSVRRDGSSKFDEENQFSTFPSAAIAWNLANEKFISDLDVFSSLKLRGSWGLTGSQAIGAYATETAFGTTVAAFNGTGAVVSGIQFGNLGNKSLKWETTEQKDLGIELGFFKGRLNLEFDYYIKNTSDLLLNNAIPNYLGGGNITSNIGEIENKGYDLSISGLIVDTKDFSWKSDLNAGYVKNKVVSLVDPTKPVFSSPNISGLGGQPEFIYKVGESLSSFWTLNYLGTWKPADAAEAAKYLQKPGDARYEDLNGDFKIDAKDYKITGSGMPTTTFGWNNTFNYKNLTLNVFFTGTFGAKKLNYTRAMATMGSRDTRQPILEEINDRYVPGLNETSEFPAFSATNNIQHQSTLFLESSDFVRLKNLSISYKLPKTFLPSSVQDLKLSLMAANLLTFTDYKGFDPESGSSNSDINQGIDYGSYPNSKTFTMGLSMSF